VGVVLVVVVVVVVVVVAVVAHRLSWKGHFGWFDDLNRIEVITISYL